MFGIFTSFGDCYVRDVYVVPFFVPTSHKLNDVKRPVYGHKKSMNR